MSIRREGQSRRDFTEKIDQNKTEMKKKEAEMKLYAGDVETERRTLDGLNLSGALEDVLEVQQAIHRAEQVTSERFGQENKQLEGKHKENLSMESDFKERREKTESDVNRIGEAKLVSREAKNTMSKAREAAIKGTDFLKQQMEITRKAREASEQAQKQMEARIKAVIGRE